jgi:hypothetical protein
MSLDAICWLPSSRLTFFRLFFLLSTNTDFKNGIRYTYFIRSSSVCQLRQHLLRIEKYWSEQGLDPETASCARA